MEDLFFRSSSSPKIMEPRIRKTERDEFFTPGLNTDVQKIIKPDGPSLQRRTAAVCANAYSYVVGGERTLVAVRNVCGGVGRDVCGDGGGIVRPVDGYSAAGRATVLSPSAARVSPPKKLPTPPPPPRCSRSVRIRFAGSFGGDKRITPGRESSTVDPLCPPVGTPENVLCLSLNPRSLLLYRNCLITGDTRSLGGRSGGGAQRYIPRRRPVSDYVLLMYTRIFTAAERRGLRIHFFLYTTNSKWVCKINVLVALRFIQHGWL